MQSISGIVPYYIVCMLAIVAMIAWELYGQPVLQLHYYSSYLIAFVFPLIGIWANSLLVGLQRKQYYALVVFVIVVMLLSHSPALSKEILSQCPSNPLVASVLLILLGLFPVLAFPNNVRSMVFCACLFGVANVFLCFAQLPTDDTSMDIRAKNGFLAVVGAVQFIKTNDPYCQARFWYNGKEKYGGIYSATASAYLWGYRLINEAYPDLRSMSDSSNKVQLGLKNRVFILSEEEESLEKINRTFRSIDMAAEVIKRETISVSNIKFQINLVETHKL
jgi:hypothetical protein